MGLVVLCRRVVVYWCVRFVFDELIMVISDLEHVIVLEKNEGWFEYVTM